MTAAAEDLDDVEDEPVSRPATDEDVRTLAHDVFAAAASWLDVPNKLHVAARGLGVDPSDPLVEPLRVAVSHRLESQRGKNPQVGFNLIPLPFAAERDGDTITPELISIWQELATAATVPASRARFLDLCALPPGPSRASFAQRAAVAYLDVADYPPYTVTTPGDASMTVNWEEYDRDLAIGRALTLAPMIVGVADGLDTIARAHRTALSRVRGYLQDALPHAGDEFTLLALLVRARSRLTDADKAEAIDLLLLAISKYVDRDWLVHEAAELVMVLEPSRRAEMQLLRVETHEVLAEQTDNASIKMHHLELAAKLARDFGLTDHQARATRAMQKIKVEDLGLQSIRASVTFPSEVRDVLTAWKCAGGSWQESLESWLRSAAPSGDARGNDLTTHRLHDGSIRSLFSTVLLGPDGLPQWTANTAEERHETELARHEFMRSCFDAVLLGDALDTISTRFGIPGEADLTAFLSRNDTGATDLAGAFARALRRYWSGDYEGCLHTAMPRVEAGARALVRLLDEPAYQVARGNNPGMYVGLPALLDTLATKGFDPDWDRFFRSFLLGPAGHNGRHNVAHGFNLDPEPYIEAVLTLRALGLFVYLLWDAEHLTLPPPSGPNTPSSIASSVYNLLSLTRHAPRAAVALAHFEVRAAVQMLRRGLGRPKRP